MESLWWIVKMMMKMIMMIMRRMMTKRNPDESYLASPSWTASRDSGVGLGVAPLDKSLPCRLFGKIR